MNYRIKKTAVAAMAALLLINTGVPAASAQTDAAAQASAESDSVTVSFTPVYNSDMESAVITGVSPDGGTLWTYTTGSYQRAQLDRINNIGVHNDIYYMVEDGTITALQVSDGSVLWKNSDFGGSTVCGDFDENGSLYVCGYLGPELFIVDSAGNTVKRIESFDSNYAWPYQIQYLQTCVAITFEMTPSGSSEILYIDLNDYTYSASNPSGSEPGAASEPAVSQKFVTTAIATSYLEEPQYGLTHLPSYVIDGTLSNAWVENAPGRGEGESVTVLLDRTCLVSGFTINAGYQKSDSTYENNSRPAKLSITFSDGTSLKVSLQDYNGQQTVTFPSAVKTSSVAFAIQSVYPGIKYEDTVISEISLF